MQGFLPILTKTPLFASIAESDLLNLLNCLGAVLDTVPKDHFALMAGDQPNDIGVVLEGKLQISREDAEGNRALLDTLLPGDYYGETLVCAEVSKSPVSILALSSSKIVKLDFRRILTVCSHTCSFHTTIIRNMVGVIARKNLLLQSRMEILEQKTIRERVLGYLSMHEKQHGEFFTVPLNRTELADYLAVDRSALSRELGRLQNEGIITYRKSTFQIR